MQKKKPGWFTLLDSDKNEKSFPNFQQKEQMHDY